MNGIFQFINNNRIAITDLIFNSLCILDINISFDYLTLFVNYSKIIRESHHMTS